jgi:hypothetical protein
VPGYYVYFIDDDGHIAKRISIECDDEAEAKRVAKPMADGHAIELWQEAV